MKIIINKKIGLLTIICLISALMTFTNCSFAHAQNTVPQKQVVNVNVQAQKILSDIDKYQEQYFTIVKRNDVLLKYDSDKDLNKDRKELDKLYKKVQKRAKNKAYLKKYKDIEKRYAECNEMTTVGINEFSGNYYKEVDALLNEVYKEVQSTIPPEDFKKLALSEQKWINTVDNYKKTFDSMEFGSIGTVIYFDYQTNMAQFRTLLLMLYL